MRQDKTDRAAPGKTPSKLREKAYLEYDPPLQPAAL